MKIDDRTDAFFVELERAVMPKLTDVGPFRIQREVAHGGQGVVYKGRDRRDGTLVAIKRSYESGGMVYDRLMRGTELASTLDHPFILPITSVEVQSESVWIVTPWIDGKPADVWARSEERTTQAIIDVFIRICSAAAHAHFRGVIHRDLRPSNILIDEDGLPCILDFGIAKRVSALDGGLDTTHTALSGDIRYLPPEVFNRTCSAPDIRQDVYSLGVLLYAMLIGNHPLDGETPKERFARVSAGDLFRTDLDRRLPGSIGAIVRKATSVDLNARYATANELIEDIRADQRGMAVRAVSHTRRYLLSRFVKRNRTMIGVGAAAVLTVVVATGFFSRSARTERELRQANSQTLGVLTSFIDSIGPAKQLGPSMDSSAVLQLVDQRIRALEIGNDPELLMASAELHRSIAFGYIQIGRMDLGLSPAQESYRIYSMLNPQSDVTVQQSGATLARILIGTHHNREAETLTRSLVMDSPPAQIGLDEHLLNLSASLVRQQRMGEVRVYLDEYLSRHARETDEYARGLDVLVIYHNSLGEPGPALQAAREMHEIRRVLYGDADTRVLAAQLLQVKSLQMLGRFEDERAIVLAILPMIERAYGTTDPRYFRAIAHLTISETELGHGASALKRAEYLLAQSAGEFGEQSWNAAQCRFLVAHAMISLDRQREAIELLIPEVDRVLERMSERPRARQQPRYWIARAYNDLGDFDLARAMIEPALVDLQASLGMDHQQALRCEFEYVRATIGLDQEQARRDQLELLVDRFAASFGQDHPMTLGVAAYIESVGL